MVRLMIICFLVISQSLFADEATDDLADQKLRLGGAFVTWNYEESGQTYAPISFEGILDYVFFEPLELSLRVGMGFGDDEGEETSTDSVGVDLYKSFYFKPYVSLDNMRVYALFGYADYDIDSNTSPEASGVSYGAGADYNLFNAANVFFEWRQLPETENIDLASISLGLSLSY
ncbi:outer membrane beta-barrel protein [Marinomonas sp. MED121]|uniref:outer membrane beta-barrel protein n=1 Tax=Marinomonas sp. MED121 TaxID=314277 RepID=UPI000315CAC3|nr:outer membrane beta-barrel protein [Marinomonas sp. MED121]